MFWASSFLILILFGVGAYAVRRRLVQHASRINEYYLAAVSAWLVCGDDAARLAALTAAKVAVREQRQSMVAALDRFSSLLASEMGLDKDQTECEIRRFVAEVLERDWTLKDGRRAKHSLAAANPVYALALDRAEPSVFARRWPELRV